MPSKPEISEFIAGRRIISPLMLCNEFGLRPRDARARLSQLAKAKLAEGMRAPSYGYRKTWCLTVRGYDRYNYLQRKQRGG